MPIKNLAECRRYSRGSEKPVHYICDDCGVEKTRKWGVHRNSYEKSGRDPYASPTYCKTCAVKRTHKTRKYTPAYSLCGGGPKKGPDHPSWKGGTYVASDGYRMIYIGNVGGKSKWENYRKEHFIVAEEMLGRPLVKGEVVHHIDGDKLNNRRNNLCILPNEKAHGAVHRQLDQLTYELVKAGLIEFDGNVYTAVDKLRELLEPPKSPE